MPTAQIIGTGLYAPERVVPNSYFDAYYGEDVDSFLREHRNIRERRYAADDQATSDLTVEAAGEALNEAGIAPTDLDLLIVSTDTPDYLSPSTAAVVQDKLGATSAGTFDVNTACAGFVTALETGANFVKASDQYEHVLVVSAYLMSRFLNFEERNIATLFADGAGAAVLRPTDDDHGVLVTILKSEGQYHDHMGIYDGGAAHPITSENGAARQQLEFRKDFPETFNHDHWTRLVRELSERISASPEAVDHYFFTQINYDTIQETMATLGLPAEKAHCVMDRYGYTGNACIPMGVADAARQHKLKRGDLVFLIASGGGAAIAGMALRWGYET